MFSAASWPPVCGTPALLSAAQPKLAGFAPLMAWLTPRLTPASVCQSAARSTPASGSQSVAWSTPASGSDGAYSGPSVRGPTESCPCSLGGWSCRYLPVLLCWQSSRHLTGLPVGGPSPATSDSPLAPGQQPPLILHRHPGRHLPVVPHRFLDQHLLVVLRWL